MHVSLRMPGASTLALGSILLTGLAAQPAFAGPELITNGNFSSYTVGGAASTTSYIVTGGSTSGGSGATLTGWTNQGYTFVFQPGTASSTGAVVSTDSNPNSSTRLLLWGPDGGTSNPAYSNNGLTTSPTGGAFIAEDGAYQQGALYQTINNLTVGQAYNLSFYWAAAQQYGFDGPTTEGWNVYWANASGSVVSSFSTQTVNTANHGFTAWQIQTYQFVATTTTMTLAFFATGGPNGTPPFSLLDGVSLTAAPEPASWSIMAVALAGITVFSLRRRRADGSSGGI